jgi:hypothetical protein
VGHRQANALLAKLIFIRRKDVFVSGQLSVVRCIEGIEHGAWSME